MVAQHVPATQEYAVHAVIGFEPSPVLNCMKDVVTRRNGKVVKLVLYKASSPEEHLRRRSEEAIETLRVTAQLLGASVEIYELDPKELKKNIVKMYKLVSKDLESRRLMACLSSGMRPLVLSLYTSLIAQPRERHSMIDICVEPEGRPEERMLYNLWEVTALLAKLSESNTIQTTVLMIIAERGAARLSELLRELNNMGVSVSKSTLYRILTRMANEGILNKNPDGTYSLKKPEHNP